MPSPSTALWCCWRKATPQAGADSWGLWPTLVVANVTEAIKKVEAQSGSVKTPRLELPNGMGVVAHVLDPDANVLGIWSPA
ncbi:hypothetical protein PWT90_02555 [Aphanocladium album]|nr:hypothetical protein PWT90_02555 [Aphanocladium album]